MMALYNPEMDHRRSIRLQGYDYSQSGAYFVTLCTHNKRHLFGHTEGGEISLNEAGSAARRCWLEIPLHFPDVELDVFTIMPNHVHGIIFINGEAGNSIMPNGTVGANDYSPLQMDHRSTPKGTSHTLGSIIRGFKIGVTKWFRENGGNVETVWQRNYYERVIRNEKELGLAREYIVNNPLALEV